MEERIDYTSEHERLYQLEQAEVDELCRRVRMDCIGLLNRPEARFGVNRKGRVMGFITTLGTIRVWNELARKWGWFSSEPGLPKDLRLSFDELTKFKIFVGSVEVEEGKREYITVRSMGTVEPDQSKAIDIVISPRKRSLETCRFLTIYRTPGYNFWHTPFVGPRAWIVDHPGRARFEDVETIRQLVDQLKAK